MAMLRFTKFAKQCSDMFRICENKHKNELGENSCLMFGLSKLDKDCFQISNFVRRLIAPYRFRVIFKTRKNDMIQKMLHFCDASKKMQRANHKTYVRNTKT